MYLARRLGSISHLKNTKCHTNHHQKKVIYQGKQLQSALSTLISGMSQATNRQRDDTAPEDLKGCVWERVCARARVC